jgi:choline-glycine betaine transporter
MSTLTTLKDGPEAQPQLSQHKTNSAVLYGHFVSYYFVWAYFFLIGLLLVYYGF